jgi:hypothetical protein
MYLERLLQINMVTLASLGALLLGMGQRSQGPPLLVAVAAVVAVWVTDITGWFRLGAKTANVLMLAAAAISLRQTFPLRNELQALDFAWFLIFLQVIIFFQKKDERKYWLLVMLSLLQVVVATLFNQGIWFGVLLVVYMLLGFSAMTLLLLYRQWESQRTSPSRMAVGRWSASAFVVLPGGDQATGVDRALFSRLGRMALHSLAIALVLFFAVPRLGETTWKGAMGNPQPLVGYSDTVALGELGQIIENRDEVLRARFHDPEDGNSRPLHGDIYLQGAILMTYDQGRWAAGLPSWNTRTELLERPDRMPQSGLVWQDITVKGLDHDELFFVAPFIPLKSTSDISFNHAQQRLLRNEVLRDREFGYRLGTTAIVGSRQQPLVPSEPKESTRRALQLPERDGAESLPHLKQLAQRWLKQSGLGSDDRAGRARYLERQFHVSGQFEYSLVGQERDLSLDPIEDFVTQHPRGHCEYFATALALMLRSRGIPARVVVGYKCDEWNPVGCYYQVRQLHAHTWVEAYLNFRHIPPELLHGKGYWPWEKEGGWLRLDPTPGGPGGGENPSWMSPVHGAMDWLEARWSSYVRELDAQRQREMIYEPIGRAARAVLRVATDPESWRTFFTEWMARLHLDQLRGLAAWAALGVAMAIMATLLTAVGWLVHRMACRLRARWVRRAGGFAGPSDVDFYRRLEALLARRGLRRSSGQTQQEFAEAAGERWAALGHDPRLTVLPGFIAEAFYRVRFGRQPLDKCQAQKVEQALGELGSQVRR